MLARVTRTFTWFASLKITTMEWKSLSAVDFSLSFLMYTWDCTGRKWGKLSIWIISMMLYYNCKRKITPVPISQLTGRTLNEDDHQIKSTLKLLIPNFKKTITRHYLSKKICALNLDFLSCYVRKMILNELRAWCFAHFENCNAILLGECHT